MSTAAIKAGAAFVELFADGKTLDKDLKAASAKLKKWGSSLTAIGAGVAAAGASLLAPLTFAVKDVVSGGAELAKFSAATGIAASTLGELNRSGVDLDTLASSLDKMQDVISKAGTGSEKAVSALEFIGLTFDDLKGKKPEEQLGLIADQLSKITDEADFTRAQLALLGTTELQGLVKGGSAGIAAKKRAGQGGFSDADAAAAKAMSVATKELGHSFENIKIALGSALIPALTDLIKLITPAIQWVADFARNNQTLTKVAAVAGAALIALGSGLATVGGFLSLAAPLLPAIVTGFGLLAGAVAAVFSPIGLLVGGLAALAVWFVTNTELGQSMWSSVVDAAAVAWEFLKKVFGGILDALSAGDWKLAAKIALEGLRSAFMGSVGELKILWAEFMNWIGLYSDKKLGEVTEDVAQLNEANRQLLDALTLQAKMEAAHLVASKFKPIDKSVMSSTEAELRAALARGAPGGVAGLPLSLAAKGTFSATALRGGAFSRADAVNHDANIDANTKKTAEGIAAIEKKVDKLKERFK